MELELMGRVFRLADSKPLEVSPSGHTLWLLARVGNLSAYIFESKEEAEFPSPCHEEEEFIYVLNGQLKYDDGRVAKTGEAVYNLPNITHSGGYAGKLLSFRVYPGPGASLPSRELMSRVIKREDINTLEDATNMSARRVWLLTDNFSVSMNESQPGSSFVDPGHPEKEIIYVVRGQQEYDDGRVAMDSEAIINLANIPHPGRRGGTKPTCVLEVKSPCSSRLLEMLKSKKGRTE